MTNTGVLRLTSESTDDVFKIGRLSTKFINASCSKLPAKNGVNEREIDIEISDILEALLQR